MTRPLQLATAGVGMVGVSFGMARYGYGLLMPDVRSAFALAPAALGLIGTGAYVGYLAATAATGALAARLGPRRTAVAGGVLAAAGMVLAAVAPSPALFAAGIVVAGASAALCYAPFADAARSLAEPSRTRVLSAVNCGTGYGIALAVPIALAVAWRGAWLAYAVLALAATAWAARVLPARARGERSAAGRRTLGRPGGRPLLGAAVLLGLGSAAYWTFAVTAVVDAGALQGAAGRWFLALAGVAGVVATLAGELLRAVGSTRAYALLATLEAAGIALLAAAPGSLTAVLASAALFGAAYNAAVSVQAIVATRLVPEQPSRALAAVMGGNGAGLLLGPVAAGTLASATGLGAMLAAGAAVVLASVAPQAAAARRGPPLSPRPARAARASRRPAAQR